MKAPLGHPHSPSPSFQRLPRGRDGHPRERQPRREDERRGSQPVSTRGLSSPALCPLPSSGHVLRELCSLLPRHRDVPVPNWAQRVDNSQHGSKRGWGSPGCPHGSGCPSRRRWGAGEGHGGGCRGCRASPGCSEEQRAEDLGSLQDQGAMVGAGVLPPRLQEQQEGWVLGRVPLVNPTARGGACRLDKCLLGSPAP